MCRLFSVFSILLVIMLFSFQKEKGKFSKFVDKEIGEINVEDLRIALGAEKKSYYMDNFDASKAKLGLELILKGKVKKKIGNSKAISAHFVCTDCHNLGKEFDNSADQNPENRLIYAQKNNLPFLPASTFWGIYNRQSFYNDDYIKKYGDLIRKAKNSLPESIQVCAKYCSSGRYLKNWELEAIMHYFKETELKIKDLNVSSLQKNAIQKHLEMGSKEKLELLNSIDKLFVQGYSAHFLETMPRENRKYGEGGDVQKGKYIYENACLHCHYDGRVAFLKLDNDKLSAQMFQKNKTNYTDLSIYQIIRQGTYAMPGRNQYMPRFTEDKMSDKQIEDLMAYLNELAVK